MRPRRLPVAVLLTALLGLGTAAPALPVGAPPACTAPGTGVRSTPVVLLEHGTGLPLLGLAYAPAADRQVAPCPVVAVLPGGGAPASSVEGLARRTAAAGYVVVVADPRTSSPAAYDAAARGALDLLAGPLSPYPADVGRATVAGWSLGARALVRTQAEDQRVDALVAWDNLAVSEDGDEGSPSCAGRRGTARAPRVPALGQASETCDGPPGLKTTAYEHWRAAGVPAAQVVLAGCDHFCWGGGGTPAEQDVAAAYTVAWLDRWLLGDRTALRVLTAESLGGRARGEVLSGRYRSALSADGIDCPDLRTGCPG